jgi:hypothetical protein
MNRLFDMKRRRVSGRKVQNLNRVLNNNKLIMGHYAGIMGDMTYGLTENVKNNLREELKQGTIEI